MGTPDAAHFPCLGCLPQAGLRMDLFAFGHSVTHIHIPVRYRAW